MGRNRLQTEQRMISAIEQILLRDGFSEIGVNSIARQAGCDKVLIYRYFGGLEGLLQKFARITELWWQVEDMITDSGDNIDRTTLPEYLLVLLKRHAENLRSKPLTLEIMAWEMASANSLTLALAHTRAERGRLLVKKIRHCYQQPHLDIGGILGVFGAAINYLLVRTRHAPPPHRVEQWWRLEQTIAQLLKTTTG